MRRFLIDTHCWLWAMVAPDRLNAAATELIGSDENTVVFSAVSAWEIAIKVGLGKLQLPEPVDNYVVSRIDDQAMKPMPVYIHHALRVAELPPHHRDPFDRLLIAQAQIEGLPLMTADAAIAAYDVEIIWAGRGSAPRRAHR
jgi:PIN domain nuclease of toxin-antitoxin system